MRRVLPLSLAVIALHAPIVLSSCRSDSDGSSTDADQVRTIQGEHLPDSRLSAAAPIDGAATTDQEEDVPLPFEPPISMDPVDGSKVSIRRTTPSTEYGGKIYHFSSEDNLRLFLEDPEKYVSGSLGTY